MFKRDWPGNRDRCYWCDPPVSPWVRATWHPEDPDELSLRGQCSRTLLRTKNVTQFKKKRQKCVTRCHKVYTKMPWICHKMSQSCHKDALNVLQDVWDVSQDVKMLTFRCLKVVARFIECVTKLSRRCHKTLHRCHKDVTKRYTDELFDDFFHQNVSTSHFSRWRNFHFHFLICSTFRHF